MTDQPHNISAQYSRANADGTTTEADFIIDRDSGGTVQMGGEGEVSQDAQDFLAAIAAIPHDTEE